jgi:hypothetical protein
MSDYVLPDQNIFADPDYFYVYLFLVILFVLLWILKRW